MNAAERKICEDGLTQEYNDVAGNHLAWALVWTVLAIVFLATTVHLFLTTHIVSPIFILLTAACFIGVWARFSQHQSQQRVRRWRRDFYLPQLREELENGNVIVERIEPTEVIEVFQNEDNQSYLFGVAPDQVLYLDSLYLMSPYDAQSGGDTRWPNTIFEMVRSPSDHSLIGVFCHGERLEPSKRYEWADCPLSLFFMETRDAVLTGTPQSIADQIGEISSPSLKPRR